LPIEKKLLPLLRVENIVLIRDANRVHCIRYDVKTNKVIIKFTLKGDCRVRMSP